MKNKNNQKTPQFDLNGWVAKHGHLYQRACPHSAHQHWADFQMGGVLLALPSGSLSSTPLHPQSGPTHPPSSSSSSSSPPQNLGNHKTPLAGAGAGVDGLPCNQDGILQRRLSARICKLTYSKPNYTKTRQKGELVAQRRPAVRQGCSPSLRLCTNWRYM